MTLSPKVTVFLLRDFKHIFVYMHKFAFDDICKFHDVQTTTKLELTVRDVI